MYVHGSAQCEIDIHRATNFLFYILMPFSFHCHQILFTSHYPNHCEILINSCIQARYGICFQRLLRAIILFSGCIHNSYTLQIRCSVCNDVKCYIGTEFSLYQILQKFLCSFVMVFPRILKGSQGLQKCFPFFSILKSVKIISFCARKDIVTLSKRMQKMCMLSRVSQNHKGTDIDVLQACILMRIRLTFPDGTGFHSEYSSLDNNKIQFNNIGLLN